MFLLAPATPAYFQNCLTLRRIWGCGLSSGTTLERKAPESPTPPPVPLRSPQYPAPALPCSTRSSLQRFHKQPFGAAILKITGCTVHFVDEELDAGPIVIQAAAPVLPEDSVETLSDRILKEEHRIYPEALRIVLSGKFRIDGRQVIVE